MTHVSPGLTRRKTKTKVRLIEDKPVYRNALIDADKVYDAVIDTYEDPELGELIRLKIEGCQPFSYTKLERLVDDWYYNPNDRKKIINRYGEVLPDDEYQILTSIKDNPRNLKFM